MDLRKQNIIRFGYPNLDEETISWIADRLCGKRVLEVGAGQGWLAYNLMSLGVNIIPTDLAPNKDNPYWGDNYSPFVEIVEKTATQAVKEYEFDVLLMSWPSYKEDWAYEAICALPPGKSFLYIGEEDGGCCGTSQFFDQIYKIWGEEGEKCPHYRPFEAIHDQVVYYS